MVSNHRSIGSTSDSSACWITVPASTIDSMYAESMVDRIRRVGADLEELNKYHSITLSPARHERLQRYYSDELDGLFRLDFDSLNQQQKIDFLLLRNHLRQKSRQLHAEKALIDELGPLIPFASLIVAICEDRQTVKPLDAEQLAQRLNEVKSLTIRVQRDLESGKYRVTKIQANKVSTLITNLQTHLQNALSFYSSFSPLFDWWVATPWQEASYALSDYLNLINNKLVNASDSDADDIIGQPIGREALLVELEAEMIAYSPEELITFAEKQLRWCEDQMKSIATDLGFDGDAKKALDHVKSQYVPPGEQVQLVRDLVEEGAEFVQTHDLVTVPELAIETLRMTMLSAEYQKIAPFFLGGSLIQVAYPTAEMSHELKKMVMRGNNKSFSRATAFHEMIPGHRLQLFYSDRHNTHRNMFYTAFSIEGWAMYWEFVFWERGDFFRTAEDKVGTLFWRMHRCARIIFSLKFHLGQMTPQQCIDMLVDRVGHERSTAEGEVRRSFKGDYGPLYQAAYMLGALQLLGLRKEVLESGRLTEKQFHDTFLRSNYMPHELFRAQVLELSDLDPHYKPHWAFLKSVNS